MFVCATERPSERDMKFWKAVPSPKQRSVNFIPEINA